MKVVITAGGTGGHIFPALALISKLKEKDKDVEILYIGTTNRMEKDIIPKEGIPYIGIEMKGLNRKNIFKNIDVMKTYLKAVSKAKAELSKFKPDIVIGFGGYISAPVIYAAHKLKIKTIIHEQNSIPGVSNKFLSRYVDKVLVSFKESIKDFPNDKTIYTGNPRSEQIKDIEKIDKTTLGFKKDKALIIIVMGSLGSLTMTKKLKETLPLFKNKVYQVLLITGKDYYDEYKDIKLSSNVKLVPFVDNLLGLMKDADLIVTRSGASTIAEITSIGLPAIMVPSPYVTNNHQYVNAKSLEDDGACIILKEEDFDKNSLVDLLDKTINDKKKLNSMRNALLKRGVTDSATRIYEEIIKLVRDE